MPPPLIQACTRCGAQWPVAVNERGAVPARWCPQCDGDLSRPFPAAGQHAAPPTPEPQPMPEPRQVPAAQQAPAPQQTSAAQRAVVTGTAAGRATEGSSPGRVARLPRGYRWVARTPAPSPDAEGEHSGNASSGVMSGPTPRYRVIPGWTLHSDVPPPEPAPDRTAYAAERARFVLNTTMALLGLAALAEALRYGLLVWGRGHLLPWLLVAFSDATVLVLGYASVVLVVLAVVATAAWLVRERGDAYRRAGRTEPRRRRWMIAAMVVPVVNLVYPGVYLTELARLRAREQRASGDGRGPAPWEPGLGRGARRPGGSAAVRDRLRRGYRKLRDGIPLQTLVRFWWGAWVLGNLTALAVVLARLGTSAQAQADGVVYSLYADLLGLAVAGVTRIVLDRVTGRLPARTEEPVRWVIAAEAGR